MISSLCRQMSSACTLRSARMMSSVASASEPEIVSVLKLNMLQDNPVAVKKVCMLIHIICVCVHAVRCLDIIWVNCAHLSRSLIIAFAGHSLLLFSINKTRNVVLAVVLVLPRERLQDVVIKVKRLERVVPFHWVLKVDKPNFTNCCPNVDSPTRNTKRICFQSI